MPPGGTPRKGRAGRKGALARGAAWRRGGGSEEANQRRNYPMTNISVLPANASMEQERVS